MIVEVRKMRWLRYVLEEESVRISDRHGAKGRLVRGREDSKIASELLSGLMGGRSTIIIREENRWAGGGSKSSSSALSL